LGLGTSDYGVAVTEDKENQRARPPSPFFGLPERAEIPGLAKCLLAWATAFCLFFYGAATITSMHQRRIDLLMPVEMEIPYVPSAILLYCSLNLMFVMMPLVLRRVEQLRPLVEAMILECILAGVLFTMLPGKALPGKLLADDGLGQLSRWSFWIALENYNYFPSLHVAFAVTITAAYARGRQAWIQAALWCWAAMIIASTVLVRQHYLVDAIGGIILAFAAIAACKKHPRNRRDGQAVAL
jgi:membrane-associated phospholipid phosphatase